MTETASDRVTAAVLIIGDEILSGRTQDTNLRDIARYLGVLGVDLAEARTGRVRTEYVAQGKEKLAEVARKFGMGSHDLARINRISNSSSST